MNSWESRALAHHFQGDGIMKHGHGRILDHPSEMRNQESTALDPTGIIHPGLYSPSGFDMMSILIRVMGRPQAQIQLGAIDASCALILCDLAKPDQPIVYASEAFSMLTGYALPEIIGRNCRFLQAPGGQVESLSTRKHIDPFLIESMRDAVRDNQEIQLEVPNFRKNGSPFVNVLTIIPIRWNGPEFRYSVGFQCAREF